ncbi:glycosyltransferase [Nocardioides bigeumensis]|uniref:Glycosyltransferase n=2 Tax=Nocardioides bigeumensis TaxID=433657 RepID=A0ABN2YG78_9ACTN
MVTTSMSVGGVQTMVRDLATRLAQEGHDVGVVSLTGRDQVATPPSVRRWELGFDGLRGRDAWRCGRRLRRVIVDFHPDVVHAHAFHANALAALAALTALTAWRTPPRPAVVRTLHSVREGGALKARISGLTSPLADLTVCVSAAVRDAHGVIDARVIHNGVDVDGHRFSDDARTAVRAEWGVSDDDVLVVSVGRMTPAKGYDTLLVALSQVAPRGDLDLAGRRLVVAVVGDGEMRPELESARVSRGFRHRVLMPGARDDVPAVLSAADAYVQSSHWEGFPVILLEATAAGLPIIATDAGGTRELDPGPALLVPAHDPGALARALSGVREMVQPLESRRAVLDLPALSLERSATSWMAAYRSVTDVGS